MEWQPIETAPRDGTEFQSWMRGSLVPVCVYYISREYLEKEYGDPDYMEAGFYYSLGYPFDECLPEHPLDYDLTHWMPLPAPPQTISGTETAHSHETTAHSENKSVVNQSAKGG